MKPIFTLRLALDLVAFGLLLFGLAYWWLGNAAHEWAGTGMFLLVIVHNVFNRRWYGTVGRQARESRGRVNVAVTFALILVMSALLVTSVVISKTVFAFLPIDGGFTVQQIHTLVGYWALVIVSVHLGLRWPVIMATTRNAVGITRDSKLRTAVLRAVVAVVASLGVWSSFELGVGSKLSMRMTLDWWDFEESVAGFFLHGLSVAGLYIFLAHTAMAWLRGRKRMFADPTFDGRLGTETASMKEHSR